MKPYNLTKTFYWLIKNIFNRRSAGVYIWRAMFRKSNGIFIDSSMDVVIEGYPRSGNTFCVAMVDVMCGGEIKIARHRHEINQLTKGVLLGTPVIVVVRDPLNSIASLVVRENIHPLYATMYYLDYYKNILNLKSEILIIDFKNMIESPDDTWLKISEYAKLTKFTLFSEVPLDQVKKKVLEMELDDSGGLVRDTHIAIPNKARDLLKSEVTSVVKEKYDKKLAAAIELYERIVGYAI